MSNETRVFIAAPTPMMRAGLRALLQAEGLEVAGEGSNLADVGNARAEVDVVIIGDDSQLSDTSWEYVGDGEIALVLLSESEQPAALLKTLPLRGWAIISPEASAAELGAAVRSAEQGLVSLSLPLASRLISTPATAHTLDPSAPEEPLTPRELEVLDLLSQGLPNKLIARALQISEHTVKFHISSIYTKLGVSSRTEAVNRGARRGLVSF